MNGKGTLSPCTTKLSKLITKDELWETERTRQSWVYLETKPGIIHPLLLFCAYAGKVDNIVHIKLLTVFHFFISSFNFYFIVFFVFWKKSNQKEENLSNGLSQVFLCQTWCLLPWNDISRLIVCWVGLCSVNQLSYNRIDQKSYWARKSHAGRENVRYATTWMQIAQRENTKTRSCCNS